MKKLLKTDNDGLVNAISVLVENTYISSPIESIANEILSRAKAKNGTRVITLNLQILRLVSESDSYFRTIRHSNYWIADGWPIVKLIRIFGQIINRRTGADLVSEILNSKAARDIKIGFIGGNAELLNKINNSCNYEGNQIMCISTEQISLPLKKTIINKISRKIKELECDLILVAIGSPKQDLVIYELAQELSNLTYIPCGASLDFQYKLKKRAPVLLQKLSMEWIWRALSEPRRLLPRYFKDLIFFLEINYRIKNESRNREKL